MIDTKVIHPKFGKGKVIQTRHKEFELLVEFDIGFTRWVRKSDVKPIETSLSFKIGDLVKHPTLGVGEIISIKPIIDEGQQTYLIEVNFNNLGPVVLNQNKEKLEKVAQKKELTLHYEIIEDLTFVEENFHENKTEKFTARRMIESFRLGIVPFDCVGEFTFGREKEMQRIEKWLNALESNTLFLVGEYGTGKTHLIQYALYYALKNEFAVAWVEIDPNETPFFKPKRVYNRLIKNFKYYSKLDCKIKGFRDFLEESIRKGIFKDNYYLKYFYNYAHLEEFWDWIEANSGIKPQEQTNVNWSIANNPYKFVPGLYDYSNTANIYCYILSSLGWAAKEVFGLKGLLLVFDEAESVNNYLYNYQLEKAENFLSGLAKIAFNDENYLDGISKSEYCKVGKSFKIPFLYRTPSGVKLLFAFTSLEFLKYPLKLLFNFTLTLSKDKEGGKIELEPLTDEALKDVFEKVSSVYSKAYDFSIKPNTFDEVFRRAASRAGKTRMFIKGLVEALDIERFKINSSE
ncbi:MAG: BREX system ATP-binding domain-containing protein [Candidatus Kapaibacteriota bacterium]